MNGELRMFAREPIEQFELILISRPLIYILESGDNFKESFMSFLKEIENYYLYDAVFEENIHMLPCQCHPRLVERQNFYQQYRGQAKAMPKKELFNKMQRCIF